MRYLVDTNLVSKQDTSPKIRNWIIQHYLQLAVSSITIAELAQGIETLPASRRRQKLAQMLEEMLDDYPVLVFGVPEAREWSKYVNRIGRPVALLDSLIAATALANDLEVATANEHDFPGVALVNPLKA